MVVGAFRGRNDSVVEDLFLPNLNLRAAFVDAIDSNIHNFKLYLSNHSALDRAHFIHGATMNPCNSKVLSIERLKEESKSESDISWVPWKVGPSALQSHVQNNERRKWVPEDVVCFTGTEILRQWASILYNEKMAKKNKLRPHILQINADDFNFEVIHLVLAIISCHSP